MALAAASTPAECRGLSAPRRQSRRSTDARRGVRRQAWGVLSLDELHSCGLSPTRSKCAPTVGSTPFTAGFTPWAINVELEGLPRRRQGLRPHRRPQPPRRPPSTGSSAGTAATRRYGPRPRTRRHQGIRVHRPPRSMFKTAPGTGHPNHHPSQNPHRPRSHIRVPSASEGPSAKRSATSQRSARSSTPSTALAPAAPPSSRRSCDRPPPTTLRTRDAVLDLILKAGFQAP